MGLYGAAYESRQHRILNVLVVVLASSRFCMLSTPKLCVAYVISWLLVCPAGPEFGLRYAINTPGFLGCSGAVAAVSAYKSLLGPMGVAHIGSVALPLPMVAVTLLYCCTYIREEVSPSEESMQLENQ